MKLHILPFGEVSWKRREEIIKGIIEDRPGPPYDYRDALYLVPNERMVKTLRALFLRVLEETTGSRGCMPPVISAMNLSIKSRLKAAPFVDDMTKRLVIEELCVKYADALGAAGTSPDVMGASLAPALAESLDRLYRYGVEDRAVASIAQDSMPLGLLLKVKKGYESWLAGHGLADLSAAKAGYEPGPKDFALYKTVILDGFYDAEPAELKLLRALSGVPDCHFILEAPGLAMMEAAEEGTPYAGTNKLLESLGVGISPSGDMQDAEASILSGALFGGRTLRESTTLIEASWPAAREISVTGALNPAEEVYFIAREIKKGFLRGDIRDLNRVLIFFPDTDSCLPIIEEAFGDLGIPYHLSQGYPLMQSPVAVALLDLLSLPQGGYSFRAMRRVFSSPFISLGEGGNQPASFDRFARREAVTGGRRVWLDRLARPRESGEDARVVEYPLKRLLSLMEGIDARPQPLSEWASAVSALIESSGLAKSVDDVGEGYLSLKAALDVLKALLVEMGQAAAHLHARIRMDEFLYIFRRSLREKRYRPGPERVTGVRVLGRFETMSEPFDVIFAGGLVEGSIPAPRRADIFLPDEAARRLGLPGVEAARTRDARLFLGLLMSAPRAYLSYPESQDGRPASPSPYIRALEPFYKANKIPHKTRACRPSDPADALGPGELMRALALKAAFKGETSADDLERILTGLPGDTSGVGRALSVLVPAPAPRPLSPPAGKEKFKVTELEEYMLCHYRYYHDRVAGSAPPDEPEDDIAPKKAGSVIHDILDDFYKGMDGPVTEANSDASLVRLRQLAEGRFNTLPDTLKNHELLRRFNGFLAPRFIETEAALTETGYTVCATEIPIEVELDDPEAGHVVITGKIDRIEMDAGGDFVVGDYKTGKYPGGGRPLRELFQLPLYAGMVKKKGALLKGREVSIRPEGRATGLVYYDLREGGMRDVVVYDADNAGALSDKKKRGKTPEELRGVIEDAFNKAVDAVRGILKGSFEPTCTDKAVCERCVYVCVCVKGSRLDEDGTSSAEGSGGEAGES